MSTRALHKIVILLTVVLFGIGLYLYATTDRNLFTAIFLRAGFVFFMAACFWKWILRLPPWAQIGWLPLVAAVIAWRPFLLKFAIPISLVLVFLNSPLARGGYKKKDWHELGKTVSGPKPETKAGSESERKPVVEVLTEPEPEAEPKQKSKKSGKKPLYGPNAQNATFRALSRVAGRQIGKMMKKKETN